MPRSTIKKLEDLGFTGEIVNTILRIATDTPLTITRILETFSPKKLEEIEKLIDAIDDNTANLEARAKALGKLRDLLPNSEDADAMAPSEVVAAASAG